MLFTEYARFVAEIDQSVDKSDDKRRDIAIYGLAAEIGSLLSAIKKAILASQADEAPVAARKRQEVKEEIGDVLWYTVLLGQLHNPGASFNVFSHDISNLHKELSADNERADVIQTVLTPERKALFVENSCAFLQRDDFTLDEYQKLAFMTARTKGAQLERVCLAVLTQLGGEVLRTTLPQVELGLNQKLTDRNLNVVLGEIVWHLAALGTLSNLKLNDIADANREKVTRRYDRGQPTPLHDDKYPPHEQFPRRFDVTFVTVRAGRLRMYFEGRPLGDELTDNARQEDGYRFHDIMHLAILAKLGWSPVIRALMRKKRKSDPKVDEVEDGARAQIVDELIVKIIHSEGTALIAGLEDGKSRPMFTNGDLISFGFLVQLPRLASRLEAERNKLWEWESAILDGSRIFHLIRLAGQGTVTIDLEKRTIDFCEAVYVNLPGMVVGVGSSSFAPDGLAMSGIGGLALANLPGASAALREAVLDSLRLDGTALEQLEQLDTRVREDGGVIVRARGAVQRAMWDARAISFRATWAKVSSTVTCTVFAMSDPRDAVN